MVSSNRIQWLNSEFAPYLNNRVQSYHVFDFLLDHCQGADSMYVSSFAITDVYVRRIIQQRERIKHITLVLDFTFASRNPRVLLYAAHQVDEVYLTNNHSKVLLIRGQKDAVSISSNNATNNVRYEAGMITCNPTLVDFYESEMKKLIDNSLRYG